MRIFVIALFLAISYAQTDDELKEVVPSKYTEFSNPENIAGPGPRRWNMAEGMDIEIPLSMEMPLGGLMDNLKAAATSIKQTVTGTIAGRFPQLVNRLKNGISWFNKKMTKLKAFALKMKASIEENFQTKVEVITPLVQGLIDMGEQLKDAITNIKNAFSAYRKKEKTEDQTKDTFLANIGDKAWKALQTIKTFFGLGQDAGKKVLFGVGGSVNLGAVTTFGVSGMFFFGGADGDDKNPDTFSVSTSWTGTVGIGAVVAASTGLALACSLNTEPGGESGLGLAVDFGLATGGGAKFTLNWAYRNKKLEFTGPTIQFVTGLEQSVQVQATYTATLRSFSWAMNGMTFPKADPPKSVVQLLDDAYVKNWLGEGTPSTKDKTDPQSGEEPPVDKIPPPPADDDKGDKRAEIGVNESPQQSQRAEAEGIQHVEAHDLQHTEAEVKTALNSKDNIKRILELMNPTLLEYFSGAFLLFALILYSARKAERKDDYLLVHDNYDEL